MALKGAGVISQVSLGVSGHSMDWTLETLQRVRRRKGQDGSLGAVRRGDGSYQQDLENGGEKSRGETEPGSLATTLALVTFNFLCLYQSGLQKGSWEGENNRISHVLSFCP